MRRIDVPLPGRLFSLCGVWAVLILGVLAWSIVRKTGGFWYTLDDPYIHLRLSEVIRGGGYGINPGIPAAPSSSILFPFLLAFAARTAFHPYVPFFLNGAATLAALWGLCRIVAPGRAQRAGEIRRQALFLVVASFFGGLFGVVFTGLEHSLHIALCLGIALGLVRALRNGRTDGWLVALIVLCPLVRFEGAVLSCVALTVLLAERQYRPAAYGILALVLAAGAWAGFMHGLGLPLLPSSVLVKSQLAAQSVGGMRHVGKIAWDGLRAALAEPLGLMTIALSLGTVMYMAGIAVRQAGRARRMALMWAYLISVVVAAHVVFSFRGWNGRYVVYINMLCVYAMAWALFSEEARAARDSASSAVKGAAVALLDRRLVAAWVLLYCFATSPQVLGTLMTPLAADSIRLQQGQMARFAHDWLRAPVAINDLGLVSYRSQAYVLDLWGLGSDEARRFRQASPQDAQWMSQLAATHGVPLAMLYESWFPVLPQTWCKLGDLRLDVPRVAPADSRVAFYATAPGEAVGLRRQLMDFSRTLPAGAAFVFTGAAPGACPV
ncbi:MAG TPA: hypothetical protein VGC69_13335 [Bordetella sp.]